MGERSPDGRAGGVEAVDLARAGVPALRDPDDGAGRGGDEAGRGPGKRDGRERIQRDAHVVPADVRAESGQKDRQIDLQAAATGFEVVAHLVNEDGQGEAKAELPSEERPIEAEEGDEAEQELELEDGEEEGLGLSEEQEDGSERTEAACPVGLALGFSLNAIVDGGDAGLDAFVLRSAGRQPCEHEGPGGASLGPFLFALLLLGDGGDAAQILGVGDGVAIGAGQGAVGQPVAALGAVVDGFGRWDKGCGGGFGHGDQGQSLWFPW